MLTYESVCFKIKLSRNIFINIFISLISFKKYYFQILYDILLLNKNILKTKVWIILNFCNHKLVILKIKLIIY